MTTPMTYQNNDPEIASGTREPSGKLLHSIVDKNHKQCGCLKETTELHFYEHMLVLRTESKLACLPKTSVTVAVPRFKIVNVLVATSAKTMWKLFAVLFVIGLIMIIRGARRPTYDFYSSERSINNPALLALGCVILFLVLPGLGAWWCCINAQGKNYCYVHFEVKGASDAMSWFSSLKGLSARVKKEHADEDFIFDYVYGCLKHSKSADVHNLAHLHSAALANPLEARVQCNMAGSLSSNKTVTNPTEEVLATPNETATTTMMFPYAQEP